ncbi:MAG: hypothetical protein IKV09_05340 [Alistipes sp.]|nr:hypothetical protein [Alistipes sp.]
MVKFIKKVIFSYRLGREIKKADRRKAATGKKQFVINVCGKPMCVSKEHIRRLVAQGYYKEGVTVADIAAKALYKAQ